MISGIIFLILFVIGFYYIYINGYLVINSKRAAMFIGSIRGNGRCRAGFAACDGYMKRVVRFKSSRPYNFVLDCELTKGYMTVELWDRKKHKLMCLKDDKQSAGVNVEKKKSYYLVFRFKSATGKYEFSWY